MEKNERIHEKRNRTIKLSALLALFFVLIYPVCSSSSYERDIIIVFDPSGSMGDMTSGGELKIDAAKDAVNNYLDGLTSTDRVALIVLYDCDVILVEAEFTYDHSSVSKIVESIEPHGNTPIADSLLYAWEYLKSKGETDHSWYIVIFTDGEETCNGDPCSAAEKISQESVSYRGTSVYIVGFLVEPNSKTEDDLGCFARVTGGENTKLSSITWDTTVEKEPEGPPWTIVAVLVCLGGAAAAAVKLRFDKTVKKRMLRHPAQADETAQKLAELYEEAGLKAKELEELAKAGEYYEKAAELWRKVNKIEEAVELYKKTVEIWKKLKNMERARKNEEKIAEVYEEAGQLSQKNGDSQKAGEFYEKTAALYGQVNNSGKSAELYELSIKMWRQIGNKEKIRENSEKAAEIYEEVGNLAQKIEELQKTGKSHKIGEFFEKAADLQREINEIEKAAELYERAARFWEKVDNKEKMKENEEKTAELYEKIGLDAHEAGDFQKAGIYYEKAACLWRKTGNESRTREVEEKALKAYEKGQSEDLEKVQVI